MQVHAFADIYPMLPDDELAELAEDIKANGQVNPIIVKDGLLIDGRNRLAACKLAGVEPWFAEADGDLDDEAIKGLVLSLNNNRRHMSKGQKAMSVAMAWPEKSRAGRGNSLKIKEFTDVNQGQISIARKVLRYLPHRAKEVMIGTVPLSVAYGEAQQAESIANNETAQREAAQREAEHERIIREAAQGDAITEARLREEARLKADMEYRDARLAIMRSDYPEYVEAVANGVLTLEQAERKVQENEERNESIRSSVRMSWRDLLRFELCNKGSGMAAFMQEYADQMDEEELSKVRSTIKFIQSFIGE